jgi:hypothetical protein
MSYRQSGHMARLLPVRSDDNLIPAQLNVRCTSLVRAPAQDNCHVHDDQGLVSHISNQRPFSRFALMWMTMQLSARALRELLAFCVRFALDRYRTLCLRTVNTVNSIAPRISGVLAEARCSPGVISLLVI